MRTLRLLTILFLATGCEDATPDRVTPPPDPSPEVVAPAPEAPTAATPTTPTLSYTGFATPESVLHDPQADVYLVSNINGSPLEADGNGFISRLSPGGDVQELKWIDGAADGVTLNAPKGMTLAGDHLFVADLDIVRVFRRDTGAPAGEIAVEGATFLNGLVTGPDDAVYVSDSGLTAGEDGFAPSGTDAVYQIALPSKVEALLRGDELGRPNGLVVTEAGVQVVTFGSGELYRIDGENRADVQSLPTGSLDGIVGLEDGSLLVSSWEGSSILRGRSGGTFEVIVRGVDAPAGIGLDKSRNLVLVPLFNANEVRTYAIE